MAFPTNPVSGTTHGINDRAWLFNGYAWERYDTAPNEVYSINGITGAIGLSAGTDVEISITGKTFTIASPTVYGVSGAIYASNLATGLLHGGIISINAGNSAHFDITAGRGQIHASGSTFTADPLPLLQYVNWSAQSGITLNYLTTSDTTWLYVDSSGVINQRTEYYTDDQIENTIIIGQLVHPSRTYINLARTNPNVAYATDKQYEQFIRAFGPIKISGHTISANGANLKLNRTSGRAFSLGRNWINNTDDPSVVSDGARTDCIFYRYYRGATAGTFVTVPNQTVIDPAKYDNGTGILATVPGGKYTIQRIFYYPNTPTLLGVYYGRAQYTSLADAAANINLEEFTEIENTRTNAIFVAYLIVKSGTTDLTNTNDALILQAGSFRSTTSGGGSVSLTLDDLTDVIITGVANYDLLTYVDGVTGWENRSISNLPLVRSFNGLCGAVVGVSSVNGATGAVTNVAVINAAQTFSGLQSFSTGISASGGTFYGSVNLQNTLLINGSAGSNGQALTSTGTGITWSSTGVNIGSNNIMITDNATTPDILISPIGVHSTSLSNTASFGPTGAYMLFLLPFMFDKGITMTRIATLSGGSSSGHTGSILFAVYDTNPSTGLPYNLKYASTETNISTTNFQRYTTTPNLNLNKGAYWIGFLLNSPSGKTTTTWSWAVFTNSYANWDAFTNGSRWFNNGQMAHLRYSFSGMTLGAVGLTLTHGFTSALTNNTHPTIGWGTSEMVSSSRTPYLAVSVVQ